MSDTPEDRRLALVPDLHLTDTYSAAHIGEETYRADPLAVCSYTDPVTGLHVEVRLSDNRLSPPALLEEALRHTTHIADQHEETP